MKILGNIIWVLFGGLKIACLYILSSVALMFTIIGIPFGLQTIKLGLLALWPFGAEVVTRPESGCLNVFMNILWLLLGGVLIVVLHLLLGLIFCITIIGIPLGLQHFKLAQTAVMPFGREVIYR